MNTITSIEQRQERHIQQATMQTQFHHTLAQLKKRLQSAINRNDHYLINQLLAEQDFILKKI